jgi:hypothetical protein
MVFKNSPRYRLEYAHNSHDDAPHRRPQRYTGPPVTLDHIRSHGCRRLLIYCNAPGCHHSANIDADRWPDATVLRDVDRRAVCGMIGADARPDRSPHAKCDWKRAGTQVGRQNRRPVTHS